MNEDFRDVVAGVSVGDAASVDRMAAAMNAMNPENLAARVADRLRFYAAVDDFERNYSDVLADPELKKQTYALDAKLAQTPAGADYRRRLRQVGDAMRTQLVNKHGKSPAPKTSQPAARPANEWHEDDDEPFDPEAPGAYSSTIREMARHRAGGGRPVFHPPNIHAKDPYDSET